MKYFNQKWNFLKHFRLVFVFFLFLFLAGCGGNEGGGSITSDITGSDKTIPSNDISKVSVNGMVLTSENEDEYYDKLENILNEQFGTDASAPMRAPSAPYLTAITLSRKTDEVLALSTYDLASKITVTATLSDKTTEPVTPAWIIYSGINSLSGTLFTTPAIPGTTVFIAVFSREGINRYAVFRLKYNGLSSLSLSKTTDEVAASGIYDLSTITIMAKDSNGVLKNVTSSPDTKWTLLSGRGSLSGTNYAAPSMVDSSLFIASYTENGTVRSASFTLRVTGQTTLILSKTTDEVWLTTGPAQYNLSAINVSVKYSTGAIVDVTSSPNKTWSIYSAKGTLSNGVYTTSTLPETAIFKVSYVEGGITKTANFTLKVNSLSSIALNKTTDEIWLATPAANYDLTNKITVSAKYTAGLPKDVTTSVSWSKLSGSGTLSGGIYTPIVYENAVFQASYTEGGITKTANFTLKVIGAYVLTLNKTTDEIQLVTGPATYDLSDPSNSISATIKYSNSALKNVTNDPDLTWSKISGVGTLTGTVFTSAIPGAAVLRASYTEGGITKTANFTLSVNGLYSISLNPTTDSVQITKLYDLKLNTIVTAKYSNGTTKNVTNESNLTWSKISGGGTLSGNIYTAPATIGSAVLRATYVEAGVTKIANFTLKSINDNIPPSVILSDDHPDNIVKFGDTVLITATFTENDKINEITPPTITITSVGGGMIGGAPSLSSGIANRGPSFDSGITNATMVKTDNLHWTYTWNVSDEISGTQSVSINATDRAGNACTPATGKTIYTVESVVKTLNITAPKIKFIGNTVQFNAKYGNQDVTDSTIWKVKNPDESVITGLDGLFWQSTITPIPNGMLRTTDDEISAPKVYTITGTYVDAQTNMTQTAETTVKILPGIFPSKKAFVSTSAQSFQFNYQRELLANPNSSVIWQGFGGGYGVNSTGLYSFPKHAITHSNISLTFPKGTMLASGEILDDDIVANSAIEIYDMWIEPPIEPPHNDDGMKKTLKIKVTDKTEVFLRWLNAYLIQSAGSDLWRPYDIAYQATWSCSDGGGIFEAGNNNTVFFVPRKTGVFTISAFVPQGTKLTDNAYYVLPHDVLFTMEVTIEDVNIEINVTDPTPLIARLEPVDASGNPMSNYRIEKEFTVSVNQNVPLDLPYIAEGSGKGTIVHLSTSSGGNLPVIHKFKYIPPAPLNTSPYHFDNDEILHVVIKSSVSEISSAMAEIILYKPVSKYITTYYPDGKKSEAGYKVVYTTGEQIYRHGSYEYWRDDTTNSLWSQNNYDRNEAVGIHKNYLANGLVESQYNFFTSPFTSATCTGYNYTYSNGQPVTQATFYSLTRGSINSSWIWTYVGTTTIPGWNTNN